MKKAFLERASQRLGVAKLDYKDATSISAKGDIAVQGLQLIMAMQALGSVTRMKEMKSANREAEVMKTPSAPTLVRLEKLSPPHVKIHLTLRPPTTGVGGLSWLLSLLFSAPTRGCWPIL